MSNQADDNSGDWYGRLSDTNAIGPLSCHMRLEFDGPRLEGHGSDPTGQFVVTGQHDPGTGRLRLVRDYDGGRVATGLCQLAGDRIEGAYEEPVPTRKALPSRGLLTLDRGASLSPATRDQIRKRATPSRWIWLRNPAMEYVLLVATLVPTGLLARRGLLSHETARLVMSGLVIAFGTAASLGLFKMIRAWLAHRRLRSPAAG